MVDLTLLEIMSDHYVIATVSKNVQAVFILCCQSFWVTHCGHHRKHKVQTLWTARKLNGLLISSTLSSMYLIE